MPTGLPASELSLFPFHSPFSLSITFPPPFLPAGPALRCLPARLQSKTSQAMLAGVLTNGIGITSILLHSLIAGHSFATCTFATLLWRLLVSLIYTRCRYQAVHS